MRFAPLVVLLVLPACREKGDDSALLVDSEVGEIDTAFVDADGDGHDVRTDCNDEDAAIHPDADEVCDGADNDCDGEMDEDDASDAETWYADSDADGYGDPDTTQTSCNQPAAHVSNDSDCDDADPRFHPGAAEDDCTDPVDYNCDGSVGYADADSDGFAACEDCNDADAAVAEASEEICDGADNDCDGTIDEDDAVDAPTWFLDADADGYGSDTLTATACDQPTAMVDNESDCDDLDAAVNPDATEVCDGIDNDCDNLIDSDDGDVQGTSTFYGDADGDGYGGAQFQVDACEAPPGFVSNSTDCNDVDAASHPGAAETCDGADNDCDSQVDEGVGTTWYEDNDSDGYGNGSVSTTSCNAPNGYVGNALDCDDFNAATHPGSYEICDSADNDCDGTTDEDDAINASTWYIDADSDGYGSSATSTSACSQPSGHAANDNDCNDADASVNPGATETCDGIDNDCDGTADEGGASGTSTWYADLDGDGFGNAASATSACNQPSGTVADSSDCDDTSSTTYPGADDFCDNTDSDCDGDTSEDDSIDASTWYADSDSDGYGDAATSATACSQPSAHVSDATDCNDTDTTTHPGATEVCDGNDNDCDGTADSAGGSLACRYGDGRDGDVNISGSGNINSEVLGTGRTGSVPEGVQVDVLANPTTTDISVSNSTGFAAGDQVLLINLQGATGDVGDVGNWEILAVDSIPGGNTVRMTGVPARTYGGSSFSAQTIVLQRIPQWDNVVISGTVTANAWDGSNGGVLAFVASGTVSVTGSLDMSEKGYRGGAGFIGTGWSADGEGRTGPGSAGDQAANDNGGGGSYGHGGYYNGNSGGGAYGTRDPNTPGNQGSSSISGTAGAVIGDSNLSQLNFGGGAGGCLAQSGSPLDGGDGGGIVLVRATTLSVTGSIQSDGQDGIICPGGDPSNRSGGAGGAIYLVSDALTLNSTTVLAEGGSEHCNGNNGCANYGGEGRIRMEYTTLNGSGYPNTSQHDDAANPNPGSTAVPGG